MFKFRFPSSLRSAEWGPFETNSGVCFVCFGGEKLDVAGFGFGPSVLSKGHRPLLPQFLRIMPLVAGEGRVR